MTELQIQDFFRFSQKWRASTYQTSPVDLHLDEVRRLEYGDYSGIRFPVVCKQQYGKKLEDVISTGCVELFLISDRMKDVLEQHSLTGWKVFPVKVLDKKNNEVEGYHGLSVTGRCGKISGYDKCEIIQKRLVPNGPLGTYYKGLYVGLDKWDGSDFFLPEKYYGIIVTKRAADALRTSKLTNVELRNLADIETDDFTVQLNIKKFSE